jgi:hypothetical protein
MGSTLRQLAVELVGELRRLNRRIADTARLPGRKPPSATATTPVLGIASLPASASLMPPVGSNEPVGRSPHGLCHGRRLRPVRRPPGFGLCSRPVRAAARADSSAGLAAQGARNREPVGHPPPPGLLANEAVTASVMGVRRLPLASQGLGADAGTGRAHDALGDPPHLDQARLVTIFDTPHDDLPGRPSPAVVVAVDRGGQRRSASNRHDAEARCRPSSRTTIAQAHAFVSGVVNASATRHHGQLRQPAQHQSGAVPPAGLGGVDGEPHGREAVVQRGERDAALIRASGAPRQWWVPWPSARLPPSVREMSNASGSR